MNCRDIEPLLYLVREGEISDQEQKEITDHLATCNNCREIYTSLVRMIKIVKEASYDNSERINMNTDQVIRISGKKGDNEGLRSNIYRFMPYIKGLAATLLVLLTAAFFYQEADFYHHRSYLIIPLTKNDSSPVISSAESDCLNRLKKKYKLKSLFVIPKDEKLVINQISEQQLTQYIEQVCGSESGDFSKVKEKLIQAGLLKRDKLN